MIDPHAPGPSLRGPHAARTALLLGTTALTSLLFIAPTTAQTLPTGGSVAAGSVAIAQPSATQLNIVQSSQSAVVNWQSFSVGQSSNVNVAQPNASSALLNRVTGSATSTIAGSITANGQIYLVNPNGIAITPTGTVNTGGGFVASTLGISDSDFMSGKRTFTGNGTSAAVSNGGTINVGRGGYAALIGGTVSNTGSINVPLGKVGLGSGEQATLDFSGDGFLQVAIPTAAGGKGALIRNSGSITANGGSVEISAATARETARNAVNISGVVQARSISGHNGSITISGGDGGRVKVSGRLDASSSRGQGGRVAVTGRAIRLEGATIDASGRTGGGTINIGGGRQGQGPLQRAETTRVDSATVIRADATRSGNGGTIILWSDSLTTFAGTITARGGALSGNGGFVETSGKERLSVLESAYVNTLAPQGAAGDWLLDPKNIIIQTAGGSTGAITSNPFSNNAGGTDIIAPSAITGAASNVILQASNDITVNSAITMTNAVMLTLNAGRSVLINANVTSRGGFTATINDENANATYRDPGRAAFTMAAGTVISTTGVAGGTAGNVSITTGTLAADSTGATTLAANIGDISLASINTSGVGAASAAGAGGNITVTNAQGSILSAASGTIGLNASAAAATSGTAAGKNGGIITLTAAGAIGSSTTAFGAISSNGGNGLGTNQAGGSGGAITLSAGTNMWTRSVLANLGVRTGSGTVGVNGNILMRALNGSITMTSDALPTSNLTLTANATAGTVTILSATNSATMTIAGNGTVNLSATVLSAMTANTLAFGSTANTNYVTIGALPDTGSPTATLAVPTTVRNIVLTSGALDTGWGSVGINLGSGSLTGASANIVLNASAGSVYLQSGTVSVGTLTANANDISGAGSFLYNNTSGIVTLNATGLDAFSNQNSIAIGGAITANTLKLSGPGEIYQQTGAFRVTNLLVSGGTFIDLSGGNNANQIANFSANTTGRIKLHDNVNLNIASIDGVNGVTANQFNLSFASTGKSVTQAAPIVANEFSLVGALTTFVTTATLTNAANSIGTFAANVSNTGTINLSGVNGLVIGQLFDRMGNSIASGVTAGTLALSNSGSVTQSQRITSTSGTNLLLLGSGDYTLTNTNNSIQTLAANTTGRINLYDNRALSIGAVTGAGGTVNGVTANALNLQLGTGFTATQTQAISVNSLTLRNSSANNAVTYTLTHANNSVANFAAAVGTAGTISLTGTSAMTIGAALYDGTNTLNGITASTLTLANSAAVTQSSGAANRISASNVALLGAGGSYTITNASNAIGTLAANTGSVNVTNGASLTIGTVSSTNGVTSTGDVTIAATGNLTITSSATKVTGGVNGTVVLSATGNFINNGGSGAVVVSGTGRWLIYSSAPGAATFGDLDSNNTAIWNATLATLPAAGVTAQGNRYLFNTPASLTFTSQNATVTYGDTAALANAYSVSGYQPGIANAFLGDTALTAFQGAPSVTSAGAAGGSAVGTYGIMISNGTLTGLNGYTIASFASTGQLTVDKRDVTVTADAQNRVYGDANPALTFTTSNLGAGAAISGSLTTTATASSDVGTYAINHGGITNANNLNYNITYVGANLTVGTRNITVTADAQTRVYGDANPALTFTTSNLGAGAAISGSLITTATALSDVGAYAINQGGITNANNLNYKITYVGANLTVGTRNISVTADAQNRVYGDANPTLSYRIGGRGLVNGDVLTGTLATSATPASDVGRYAITQGSLAASPNYTLTYQGAELVVTPAPRTIDPPPSIPPIGIAVDFASLASSVVRDAFTPVALPENAAPILDAPSLRTSLGGGVFFADPRFDTVFLCFGGVDRTATCVRTQ